MKLDILSCQHKIDPLIICVCGSHIWTESKSNSLPSHQGNHGEWKNLVRGDITYPCWDGKNAVSGTILIEIFKICIVNVQEKFYWTTIRSALLYGIECWVIKRYHAQKMSVADMCILRWMCGNTRRDKVRNENICTCWSNAPIRQVRGRYGDVHTRGENNLTRTLSLSTGNHLHRHNGSSRK